jgi:hypothetical protein
MPSWLNSVYHHCLFVDGSTPSNRRVRTRTHGGVTGAAREGLPMSICFNSDDRPCLSPTCSGRS